MKSKTKIALIVFLTVCVACAVVLSGCKCAHEFVNGKCVKCNAPIEESNGLTVKDSVKTTDGGITSYTIKVSASTDEINLREYVSANEECSIAFYQDCDHERELNSALQLKEGFNTAYLLLGYDNCRDYYSSYRISVYRARLYSYAFYDADNLPYEYGEIEENTVINAPQTLPEKEFYEFDHWLVDYEKKAKFPYEITEDTEFYPVFEPKRYAVTYVLNDGINDAANKDYYTIESDNALRKAYKADHTFSGWYLDSEFTKPIKNLYCDLGDVTLYAKWAYGTDGLEYEPNGDGYTVTAYTGGYASKIVVPETWGGLSVTEIGKNVFCEKTYINEVTIPLTVTKIGYRAFSYCENLKNINLHDGIESIGSGAFEYCKSLEEVAIPQNITDLPSSAFEYCESLTSVKLPKNLKTIGLRAFIGCSELTRIDLPESLERIDSQAFRNCSKLNSLVIPDGVIYIGEGILSGCSAVTDLTIPFVGQSRKEPTDTYQYPLGYIFGDIDYGGSVASNPSFYESDTTSLTHQVYYIPQTLKTVTVTGGNILRSAFYAVHTVETVTLPSNLKSIGDYAFSWCSGLKAISIPNTLTDIGNDAFSHCHNLESIKIPYYLQTIGDRAFENCSKINSVNLSVHLTKIGASAFAYSGLKTLSIPENVTYIGDNAFSDCTNLEMTIWWDAVNCVKAGSKDAPVFGDTQTFNNIHIAKGVVNIPDHAFYKCGVLTILTIPESVKSVGAYAVAECKNLSKLYYDGNEEQWKNITLDKTWKNGSTLIKTVKCLDREIAL